jgi:uncharacterized protein (DUF1015 family)
MADVREFRALRYDPARVDPATTLAPPYDVISPTEQASLYDRSPYNVVRIEYGRQLVGDDATSNRYTRAASDLTAWRGAGILTRDASPALYHYRLTFDWAGRTYRRSHVFAVVRLEEWDTGVIRPHERTLAGPKEDRLALLRATRTHISPVYCLYRCESGRPAGPLPEGAALYDFSAAGQRHELAAITEPSAVSALRALLARADVYVADGHHRYETALKYRDERRAACAAWSGDEPEDFVLMALTDANDPGLLVLPTHRVLHRAVPPDALSRIGRWFDVSELPAGAEAAVYEQSLARRDAGVGISFVVLGLQPGSVHLLTLRAKEHVAALMPRNESPAWKDLDVNVLQFALLQEVFGIDEAALAAGGAVSYTQRADEALQAVRTGAGSCAFLLSPTPVNQVIAVSDAGGRMPQKSTFFHPKLPTGLVLNPLD